MRRLALACCLALALAAQATAQYCTVDKNNDASVCKLCDPPTGCLQCAVGTKPWQPKMRVLNNGPDGALQYNRCTTCDLALKCRTALDCAPTTPAGLPGCTKCGFGFYPKAVDVSTYSAGGPVTTAYQGCASCAESEWKCAPNTACDATGCIVCPFNRFLHRFGAVNVCSTCQELSGAGCIECYTDGRCKACAKGYYMDASSKCQPCTIANCEKCAVDGLSCDKCARGFYVADAAPAECTACTVPDCTACAGDGTCAQCARGFYRTADGQCALCTIDRCAECAADGLTCARCYMGLNWIDAAQACLSCTETGGAGCKSCNADGSCASCWTGFSLNPDTSTCIKCADISAGCLTCDATTCLSCRPGTYLDAASTCQSCSPAGQACVACVLDELSALKCTQCAPLSYLSAEGKCVLCGLAWGKACLACTSTACTKCLPFYKPGATGKCVFSRW